VVIAGAAGMVSVTELDWVLSATEVAVRVTVCAEAVAAGAVNVGAEAVKLESEPIVGAVQVTPALLLSLATVAVSSSASFPSTIVAGALTETLILGLIVSVTEADLLVSATEVAVRVTDCAALVAAGAVYVGTRAVKLVSEPIEGAVQVTPALLLSLATVAVTVTVPPPLIVVADEVTETLMVLDPPPPLLPPPPPHPERPRRAMMARADTLMNALVLRPEGTNGKLGMEATPDSRYLEISNHHIAEMSGCTVLFQVCGRMPGPSF